MSACCSLPAGGEDGGGRSGGDHDVYTVRVGGESDGGCGDYFWPALSYFRPVLSV